MGKPIILLLMLVIGFFTFQKYGYLITSYKNVIQSSPIIGNKPLEYSEPSTDDFELSHIKIIDGYSIGFFAKNVPGARSMALGNNIIYVGSRQEGTVYALTDSDDDGIAESRHIVAKGLNSPNGIAYKNNNLYVAEDNRIIRFTQIDMTYNDNPNYEVIYDKFPNQTQHSWKYIAFGPDDMLYIGIGMPCNICSDQDTYGRIIKIDVNIINSDFEVVATGVRNTVGFDWNPLDKSLWFTDNGRDWLGDDAPPDELNHVSSIGLNFGFPYCHGGIIPDPVFGINKTCSDYEKPALNLDAHVAALGAKFIGNQLFIAEHGSWNRSIPQGYRVGVAKIDGNQVSNYRVFAQGWLNSNLEVTGRPVDILPFQNGMLISDDKSGVIYRIYK